jgi:hypothetical protein
VFHKPSVAEIYIDQLRARLDRTLVPLYPPDAAGIRVGTIGRFVEGQFDRRGHLAEVLDGEDAFEREVPMATPSSPAGFTFHSAGSVHLAPSASVSVAGKDMLKAKLSFTGDRAVVASFAGVVEEAVQSPRKFDDLLWRLYVERRIDPDEVVVFVHRRAASGVVLINRKGGVQVEVLADPALVGAAISFEGLGLGPDISFGEGSAVSARTTGTELNLAIKAKGLIGPAAARVDDVRRFEAGNGRDALSELEGLDVPLLAADDVIAEADFERLED